MSPSISLTTSGSGFLRRLKLIPLGTAQNSPQLGEHAFEVVGSHFHLVVAADAVRIAVLTRQRGTSCNLWTNRS